MTYTYNYTDNLIQTLMYGINNPFAAFPPIDGWTKINTTKDLSAFMDNKPGREYFIVWVFKDQFSFDYVHPKTSPITNINTGTGNYTYDNDIRMLDLFAKSGSRIFIKAGSTVKPDLPENPTDKIYNVVVATSDTDYDDPDNEVVLVEAVRLFDGTWSGYTADGHPHTNINHAYIKNFQTEPTGK